MSDAGDYVKLLVRRERERVDDEQLYRIIVEWARRDVFNRTGRVFLSELSKCFEGVTPERVLRVLRAKGARFDMPGYPDCDAVYITFQEG